jgi:protein-tyrosine-phosphatase/DNA-binding transcriptional ArsR family regulator
MPPSDTAPNADAAGPPSFVRLAAHPLRWRLMQELVQSDRAVRELMALLDEPQSLVSYHLRLLREGGLVTAHRSAADGRDSYYSIDLAACREGLSGSAAALHPGLGTAGAAPACARPAPPRHRPHVLFLCTGNSARSQIAEALLEKLSEGAVDASSAGSHPKPLHPNAVKVLRRYGIDISHRRTKHVDELRSERFDTVITLCDRVREVCPEFASRPELVHWSVPDPALAASTDRASFPAFARTAAELETRIAFRLPLLTVTPTRRTGNVRTTEQGRTAHVQ